MAAGPVGLVVPIKPLGEGKSRLRGALDSGRPHDGERHRELALALALDTIAAAGRARAVARIVVVTSDPAVARAAARFPRVEVIPEEDTADGRRAGPVPRQDRPYLDPLNAALRHGAAALPPSFVVGALQADLPALRPAELDAAVGALAAGRVYCADAAGEGTTLLLAAPGTPLDPRFGPGSAAAHQASGAAPIPGELPGLRRDVDTPADLDAAAALGLGPRTAALLAAPARCPRTTAEAC